MTISKQLLIEILKQIVPRIQIKQFAFSRLDERISQFF
jgi:hypothetical protein